MTDLRTDEEQVELIKSWWKENGKTLLLSVIVVLGGWFGWNSWQTSQQQKAEAASELYSQLVDAVAQPAAQQTEEQKASAVALATELKTTYAGTAYADFGALFLARFAADAGDFDAAAAELQAVVNTSKADAVKYTAQARLAQVLIQQEKFDEALALVNTVPDPAYTVQFEDAKGDALYRKGDNAEARNAWIRARDAAQTLGLNTQPLQRKIDALAAVAGDA